MYLFIYVNKRIIFYTFSVGTFKVNIMILNYIRAGRVKRSNYGVSV